MLLCYWICKESSIYTNAEGIYQYTKETLANVGIWCKSTHLEDPEVSFLQTPESILHSLTLP